MDIAIFFGLFVLGAGLYGFSVWGKPRWQVKQNTFCWLGAVVVSALVVFLGAHADRLDSAVDTEVINGEITGKLRERVSCNHYHDCNCRSVTSCSGTGTSRTCSTSQKCDSCPDHPYDVDYTLQTSVGGISVDRVDRQGVKIPPRWEVAKVGEPVAKAHTYKNLWKAAETNVVNTQSTASKYPMPQYPLQIYDLHRLNRAVLAQVPVKNSSEWADEISKVLRTLGPKRQVNLVVVLTGYPEDYARQLKNHLLGGKKNDVIVVLGTTGETVDWVSTISWSNSGTLPVDMRETLINRPLVASELVPLMGKVIDDSFVRRQMADFEYLWYEIPLSTTAIILLLIFGAVPYLWLVPEVRDALGRVVSRPTYRGFRRR